MTRTFDVAAFLGQLAAMDSALVQVGFHQTSEWWATEQARVLSSLPRGVRRWILRVGRRGGKSSTLCRLAVAWALWGPWSVPAGDLPVVTFVSVDRREASARLRTIADILRALGLNFDQRDGELELEVRGRPLVFRVATCTVRGVVGFTSVLVLCDEAARWESTDTAANPAREIVGSLAPTLATQPFGLLILSSSPWATDDYHHECFELGNTDHQLVSHAATWDANPSLTEAQTRALEPHYETWLREYPAIPSDSLIQGNYFGLGIDLSIATEPIPTFRPGEVKFWIAADPAFSETGDRFGFAVVSSTVGPYDPERRERTRPRLTRCHLVGSWQADRSPRDMALRLRNEVCAPYRQHTVYTDQHEGRSWAQLARDVGLQVRVVRWHGGPHSTTDSERRALSKPHAFSSLRREMLDQQVLIPDDPSFVRELRSVRTTLLPSGAERIDIPRTKAGHGDRVSAFVLAASMALEHRPQLPPAWQTVTEEIEASDRDWRREQFMTAINCGGGGYFPR